MKISWNTKDKIYSKKSPFATTSLQTTLESPASFSDSLV